MNKTYIYTIGVLVLVLIVIGVGMAKTQVSAPSNVETGQENMLIDDGTPLENPDADMIDTIDNGDPQASTQPRPTGGKLKADVFTGKLEEVNTGCFADGECYVVVDGVHVRTLMGWNQNVVGSVQGVEGFGDLEAHIGEYVEVYAQDLMASENMFTLYGSEGFYVKLVGKTKPAPEVN